MGSRSIYVPRRHTDSKTFAFSTAQEAWFWFMQAQRARSEGARILSGLGALPRPCEPLDILKVLDRLYRQRRLFMDHVRVLRHYGARLLAPDDRRSREMRAHRLWVEAFSVMEPVLISKGIVEPVSENIPDLNWVQRAEVFEGRPTI